ncbi:MAG: DUF3226 domain-containing protein [Planctomycetota bacterium]|jgi:hypothetical protein
MMTGVRILLVEGDDDQHVAWNLFRARKVPFPFYVLRPRDEPDLGEPGRVILGQASDDEANGDRPLLDSIPARLDTSDLERLAVVVDANDKGPQSRWDAIRQRLRNEGYDDLPKSPDPNGTVLDLPGVRGRRPIRFGAWVMPDNQSTGMLEDFVAGLIRDDDEMLPFVKGFLDAIPEQKRRFHPVHRPKARIHSWLAVSERPGRPMGQAIQADKYLDADHPTVEPFLNWIQAALVD